MNIKMSEADTEAQKQEAIDLTLLVAKVRNEALDEAMLKVASALGGGAIPMKKISECISVISALKAYTTP